MSIQDYLEALGVDDPHTFPNAIPADQVPLQPLSNRPFLARAVEQLVTNGFGLLAGPVGCGKTRAGAELIARFGFRRLLIVCTRRSFHKWEEAIRGLYPDAPPELYILEGVPVKKRKLIWGLMKSDDTTPRVVICSWGLVRKDKVEMSNVQWSTLIGDESQAIANETSTTYRAMRQICRAVAHNRNYFFSGTEMAKGGHNLWTHLNLMAPASYGSYYKFLGAFFVLNSTQYGQTVLGLKKKEATRFREAISKFVVKIKLSETRGYIPRVQKIVEKVEMAKTTLRVYNGLIKDMHYKFNDHILMSPTVASNRIRLRQLLCCPKLIHPSLEYGAGIHFAASHAKSIGRQHIGIMMDFPEAMDHFEHFLRSMYGYKWVYKLRGGCTPAEVSTIPKQFAQHVDAEEPSAILLSIPFCDSFDLPSAHNGYVVGPTWSNVTDTQANGRFARGDKPYINLYYAINNNSIEEEVLTVLDLNQQQMRIVHKSVRS